MQQNCPSNFPSRFLLPKMTIFFLHKTPLVQSINTWIVLKVAGSVFKVTGISFGVTLMAVLKDILGLFSCSSFMVVVLQIVLREMDNTRHLLTLIYANSFLYE